MMQMALARNGEELLYRAITYTVGGRECGRSCSIDGNLTVDYAFPGMLHSGTNPEQMLAAAWSACFASTVELVASRRGMTLPHGVSIDAEVDLNFSEDGYFLSARLYVDLPQIDRAAACDLIEAAYRECPFSKAIHGNVDVNINLLLAGSRRDGQAPTATIHAPNSLLQQRLVQLAVPTSGAKDNRVDFSSASQ